MTTVIAIRASNGIVFSSDSLFIGGDVKKFGTKIFQINDSVVLGVAGRIDHSNLLIDALRKQLGNQYYDKESFEYQIEDALLNLHRRYNLRWTELLGINSSIFSPQAIVGVRFGMNDYGLYRILFRPEPWLSPIEVYDAIGSGQTVANFVLSQQARAPLADKLKFSDLDLSFNTWIAIYTLAEIKTIDSLSGGNTQVLLATNEKIYFIEEETVKKLYRTAVDSISAIFENMDFSQNAHQIREMVKGLYPTEG
jgi:20S proteasome alpha/beta subunit